jgi:PHD/YefM family antitoxin component YafN of YafNO toxin-antitoxin module
LIQRRGKAAVALIDAEELSSMMELVHLLRSPVNAAALFKDLDEPGVEMTLEEFLAGKHVSRYQSLDRP